MNLSTSHNAVTKRIRRALRRWNWTLVVARGDRYRNDQHLGSLYLIDANGNVQDHHCDLMTLAKDLRVLGKRETLEGCPLPQAEAGPAVEAVELKDDQGRVWFSGQRVTKVPYAW